MKALGGAFNLEKAIVGSFFVIVKTDGSFAALVLCVAGAAPGCSTVSLLLGFLQTADQ